MHSKGCAFVLFILITFGKKGLIFKVNSVSTFRVDPTLKSIKEKMLDKEAEEREKEEAKSGMVTN